MLHAPQELHSHNRCIYGLRCLAFISLTRVAARANAVLAVRCKTSTSSLSFAGRLAAVCGVSVFELLRELGVSLSKLLVENLELNPSPKCVVRLAELPTGEPSAKDQPLPAAATAVRQPLRLAMRHADEATHSCILQ